MLQAETGVTYDKFTLGLGGALTLVGPNPSFGTPNSNPFKIIGADCPTCGPVSAGCSTTAVPPKDAIGIYDPTHAKDPSAVQTVIGDLAKPNNYIGANSAPDVHNANLGTMTAADLNSFVGNVASVATYTYGSNPSSIYLGSLANPAIDVVNGDFSLGPSTGYGILVVTGTLTISGNYSWNGLILVIGAGASVMNGGGNGQITGGVFIANTAGGTINAPSANWNGGGNGIQPLLGRRHAGEGSLHARHQPERAAGRQSPHVGVLVQIKHRHGRLFAAHAGRHHKLHNEIDQRRSGNSTVSEPARR